MSDIDPHHNNNAVENLPALVAKGITALKDHRPQHDVLRHIASNMRAIQVFPQDAIQQQQAQMFCMVTILLERELYTNMQSILTTFQERIWPIPTTSIFHALQNDNCVDINVSCADDFLNLQQQLQSAFSFETNSAWQPVMSFIICRLIVEAPDRQWRMTKSFDQDSFENMFTALTDCFCMDRARQCLTLFLLDDFPGRTVGGVTFDSLKKALQV
jgi:hypothetical protein